MKKQLLTTLASTALIAGSLMVITPANAATTIKSGQACSKENAIKRVKYKGETYVYNCVKNPRYKKTTLTWTLEECLAAIKDFNESKARIDALVAAGGTASTIDTELLGLARQLRNMSCKPGV